MNSKKLHLTSIVLSLLVSCQAFSKTDPVDQYIQCEMQTNKIPVTYAIFPDEGHQLLHPGNRMAFYALAEKFLAKTLKGRVEPYDNSIQSSMIVKVDDFGLVS